MAGIELRGISRVFPGGGKGVDGLDLAVREGELLVLVGPSGSGKTTTLRVVAGLDEATSGSVWIDGREVTKLPPRDRNVAMVFQGLGLYEHLSVEENLAFGSRTRRSWMSGIKSLVDWPQRFTHGIVVVREDEQGIRNKIGETAHLLGIQHLLARKPGELSGGEQQRVALGRALVRQPAALLLDEPLSSLDPPLRSELRQQLKELQRRLKVTTVYVTHDQAEAMSLGERIAVIRAGKIEQVGTPAEIYDQPRNRFVAGFFGEGMNWEERKAESGKRNVLGVRPEDVVLRRENKSTGTLHGIVTGVQWLGSHTVAEVDLEPRDGETEKVTWLSRVAGRVDFQRGENVFVEISPGKEHWFDAESGERMSVSSKI
ncbi:MAG: ABC transporter ATP-binding protein [Pirellulaceae bacterium]